MTMTRRGDVRRIAQGGQQYRGDMPVHTVGQDLQAAFDEQS